MAEVVMKRTKELNFQVITSLKSTRIVNTLHITIEKGNKMHYSEYTDILNITVILNRHLLSSHAQESHVHEFYSESITPEASDMQLNGKKVVPWPK